MIAKIAAVVALLLAAMNVYSAVNDAAVLLLLAVIPLIAGIGILRRRVWSAYGFSLFLAAQLVLLPVSLLRGGGPASWEVGVAVGVTAALILLFLAAGRSLASAGAARGRATPWVVVSLLLVVPFLFFQPFIIPTGAMEDTLVIGDRILVQRFPRPEVTRGDLIVFRLPADGRQTLIKRVIGMPGDRIRISNKTLIRNGAALKEPYAVHKTDYLDPYRDNFPGQPAPSFAAGAEEMLAKYVENGELVVPQGKYFVMGDNRDNSWDSRYWGFVDAANII